MPSYRHYFLQGSDSLLEKAEPWNLLWQRSYARQPSVQAEGIANWVKHFAQDDQFSALCIEGDGSLMAALPLITDRYRGVYPLYRLPANCWANAGDLLVDREAALDEVMNEIVVGLQELTPGFCRFDEITLGAPQWIEFQAALSRLDGKTFIKRSSPVGVIDVLGDWERYEKSWSGNHRGAVKRTLRKIEKQGELRVERCSQPGVHLEQMLRTAFAIEDRSWKGESGTSILRSPGVLEYMLDEGEIIAHKGQVDLWMLYLDDRPIAFEACQVAKGTCFSQKIGYDPEFSKFGPGRLLRYLQLQTYHEQGDCRLLDTLGTFNDSKAKWATRTYEIGQLFASVGTGLSKPLLSGYEQLTKTYRALRGVTPPEVPKLGAAGYLEGHSAVKDDANVDANIDGVVGAELLVAATAK